jgi:hypothetical protein
MQPQACGRAERDCHDGHLLDFDVQAAARREVLRTALQRVPPVAVSLEGWCRLVNPGSDIDPLRFPAFPALYLAENFETAFREYHGLPKDSCIDGLRSDELNLADPGCWTALQVTGRIDKAFDLTTGGNLEDVCRILARFKPFARVRRMAGRVGTPALASVGTPNGLLKTLMETSWKSWPVHFAVPANSQVFAQLVVEAGFEGILYRSAKGAGKCLAVFTRRLGNSGSRIALHGRSPPGLRFTEITAANCLDI